MKVLCDVHLPQKQFHLFNQNLSVLVDFFNQRNGYAEINKDTIVVLINQQK